MRPVLPKLIIFTHGIEGSFIVCVCACYDERAAVEDITSIRKLGSTLLLQNSKHDEKIEDIKSMLSVNMTTHPTISLHTDHMIMFGSFCDLYMTTVRSIWRVKAVPAHIWPDLAGGMFLRTGQVSCNTTAATSTSYLLPSENEVACLVASSFSSNVFGNLAHTFPNGICTSPT
jgi:hypothetical protein